MTAELNKDHRNTSQANLYVSKIYLMFYCYNVSKAFFIARLRGFLFSFAFCVILIIWIQLLSRLVFSCVAASKFLLNLKHGILLVFFVVFIIS